MPVKTSPLPAVAIPLLPVELNSICPFGKQSAGIVPFENDVSLEPFCQFTGFHEPFVTVCIGVTYQTV